MEIERQGKLWLGMCAFMALGTWLAWGTSSSTLEWQPQVALSQPWRWWTAAWVHWNGWHLTANLCALAVLATLGRAADVPPAIALAWAASWPFTHLGLLLQPELLRYGGLSGVLHGGIAVVAIFIVRRLEPRVRWIGWAMLLGLATKVLLETPWESPLRPWLGVDYTVAPLAHATGALSGALATLLALARDPVAPAEAQAAEVSTETQRRG